MGIKKLRPTSAATRFQTYLTREEITTDTPYEPLLEPKKRISGRNNDGHITMRRRGGGAKRLYRIIDFKRDKTGIPAKVATVEYDPKDEIEKGISAVRWAVGAPTAPYFRFPALRQPPELIEYLGKRNIGIFSADMDSFDFKMRKPEQVRQSVLAKLKKHGKGIVLMHDFQHATAEAAMDLLNDLKASGYKVVFMRPKFPVTTIASYDEQVLKLVKGPGGGGDTRPTSSVVRTISE